MDANRQAYLAGVRHELLRLRSQAAELLLLGRLDEDSSGMAIRECLDEAGRLLDRMEHQGMPAWRDDTAAMTSLCTDLAARVGHLGAQVHTNRAAALSPAAQS